MGKQINYWLKYEEFLQIAQAALDCGCIIIKPDSEEIRYGQSLDIITEDECRYYFYLPEAGFSFIHDKEKKITGKNAKLT